MTTRLRLEEQWTKRLCDLPESGMGYQRVDVELRNGLVVHNVLVFNAEELEWPAGYDSIRSADIVGITLNGRADR